jgi:hypothetical protein
METWLKVAISCAFWTPAGDRSTAKTSAPEFAALTGSRPEPQEQMSSRLPAKDGAPGIRSSSVTLVGRTLRQTSSKLRRLFLVIHPGFPQEYLGFIRWCIV